MQFHWLKWSLVGRNTEIDEILVHIVYFEWAWQLNIMNQQCACSLTFFPLSKRKHIYLWRKELMCISYIDVRQYLLTIMNIK